MPLLISSGYTGGGNMRICYMCKKTMVKGYHINQQGQTACYDCWFGGNREQGNLKTTYYTKKAK